MAQIRLPASSVMRRPGRVSITKSTLASELGQASNTMAKAAGEFMRQDAKEKAEEVRQRTEQKKAMEGMAGEMRAFQNQRILSKTVIESQKKLTELEARYVPDLDNPDDNSLVEATDQAFDEIITNATAGYSALDNPELYEKLESMRVRAVLNAGQAQSQKTGAAVVADLEKSSMQRANIVASDPGQVGLMLADLKATVDSMPSQFSDAQKSKIMMKEGGNLVATAMNAYIDNGDAETAYADLESGFYDDTIDPSKKQAIMRRAQTAIQQGIEINSAAIKSGAYDWLVVLAQQGGNTPDASQYHPDNMAKVLTNEELAKYTRDYEEAATRGIVRNSTWNVPSPQLDDMVRAEKAKLDATEDPDLLAAQARRLGVVSDEIERIKNARESDPVGYSMESSQAVTTLYLSYKQAEASGDQEATTVAFGEYANATIELQNKLVGSGNESLLPPEHAAHIRNVLTGDGTAEEKYGILARQFAIAGKYTNIVARDIFGDKPEAGMYQLAMVSGQNGIRAVNAIDEWDKNLIAISDRATKAQVLSAAGAATKSFNHTFGSPGSSAAIDTTSYIARYAADLLKRGVTDDVSNAASIAMNSTLGARFHTSGALRTSIENQDSVTRMDSRRAYYDAVLAPEIAARYHVDALIKSGMSENAANDVVNSSIYNVANNGDGKHVVIRVVGPNGYDLLKQVDEETGKITPVMIPWDVYRQSDNAHARSGGGIFYWAMKETNLAEDTSEWDARDALDIVFQSIAKGKAGAE